MHRAQCRMRRQYMRLISEVLCLHLMQANLVASGTKQTMVERLLSHESSQQDAARSHSPTDSDQSGSDEGSSSSQHLEEESPAATTVPVTSGPYSVWSRPAGRTHAGDAPVASKLRAWFIQHNHIKIPKPFMNLLLTFIPFSRLYK